MGETGARGQPRVRARREEQRRRDQAEKDRIDALIAEEEQLAREQAQKKYIEEVLDQYFELKIDYIIVDNKNNYLDFINLGVPEKNLLLFPHPVNEALFNNKIDAIETKRDVILVSNLTSRKRPDLIFEVIKRAPHLNFTIYGKNWNKWNNFENLIRLPNLVMKEFEYKLYPKELSNHHLFLSLSDNESGPVPLLESLACGLRVLATDTGTARDLIKNPNFIIPINLEPLDIIGIIDRALSSPPPIFDVAPYTEAKAIEKIYHTINTLKIAI
jgi:glycosyltransferase involved in cell wall biosynthesis